MPRNLDVFFSYYVDPGMAIPPFDYEVELLPPTKQSEMDKFLISNVKRIKGFAEVLLNGGSTIKTNRQTVIWIAIFASLF